MSNVYSPLITVECQCAHKMMSLINKIINHITFWDEGMSCSYCGKLFNRSLVVIYRPFDPFLVGGGGGGRARVERQEHLLCIQERETLMYAIGRSTHDVSKRGELSLCARGGSTHYVRKRGSTH